MRKALIVQGGWDGHQPREVSDFFAGMLRKEGFDVTVSDSLDSFLDEDFLFSLSLIVSCWTMGEITPQQCRSVTRAVAAGVGLSGVHGGMCDSFRNSVEWQFMTGGQWVAHPGGDGVEHLIEMRSVSNPLVCGVKDFKVKSEQYYLHVDPAAEVLATTRFPTVPGPHTSNGSVNMPVIWTKSWGKGRVYYNSLGHQANIVEMEAVQELIRRGMLWAASAEAADRAYLEDLEKIYPEIAKIKES